jgi:hypothetical protein
MTSQIDWFKYSQVRKEVKRSNAMQPWDPAIGPGSDAARCGSDVLSLRPGTSSEPGGAIFASGSRNALVASLISPPTCYYRSFTRGT